MRRLFEEASLWIDHTPIGNESSLYTVLLSGKCLRICICVSHFYTITSLVLIVCLFLLGAPETGKTALAVKIAQRSGYPFTKICTPENMIGYSEPAKVRAIKRVSELRKHACS